MINVIEFIKLKIQAQREVKEQTTSLEQLERKMMFAALSPCCQHCQWLKYTIQDECFPAFHCRITDDQLITCNSKVDGKFKADVEMPKCPYFRSKDGKHIQVSDNLFSKSEVNHAIRTLKTYCESISHEACAKGDCWLANKEGCPFGMPCDWEEIK